MQPTVLEPHLVTAARASLTLSGVASHFLGAKLFYSDEREKVSVFHTVWPFVKWALVWLCFHGPQLISLSPTLPFFFFFLYRSLCGWKRPSSEAHSLFFPYVSGIFITLSFRQEQSHSSLNQQKFSISWKLNSSAPEISLITSHSQCAI